MTHLDESSSVIAWSNEEIVIPYLSPVDNRWHRYFPDFFVKVKNKHGIIESMILEVKPKSQSEPPVKKSKITRRYINEVMTWGINEAKWKAAVEYCKDKQWTFKVITEEHLGL